MFGWRRVKMLSFLSFIISFCLVTTGYTTYKLVQSSNLELVDKNKVHKIVKEYNLREDFKNGKILCPITKKRITYENVGVIRKASGLDKPIFISDSVDVMRKASEYPDELLYRLSYNSQND